MAGLGAGSSGASQEEELLFGGLSEHRVWRGAGAEVELPPEQLCLYFFS